MSLESDLIQMYNDIKKEQPGLSTLTFDVATYSGKLGVSGWIHIGTGCRQWKSFEELQEIASIPGKRRKKNEILFRRF